MDKLIKELVDKEKLLFKQAHAISAAIGVLRDNCEHDWQYDGHGHNSNYYLCTKCGLTKED